MHRRQYLPGSQHKLSRTRLAETNRRLRKEMNDKEQHERTARENAEKAALVRETTGLRGFINKVKRALLSPVKMPTLRKGRA